MILKVRITRLLFEREEKVLCSSLVFVLFGLSEENDSLREQLVLLHKEMDSLEEQHKQQMNEAIENMGVLQDTHRKEMARVREVTMQQSESVLLSTLHL